MSNRPGAKRIKLTSSQRSALEDVLFEIFNEGVGMTPPAEIMRDYIDRIAESFFCRRRQVSWL